MSVEKKDLFILGFAPTSLMEAFSNLPADGKAEMWALNEMYAVPGLPMDKITRWFEIHDTETHSDIDTNSEAGKKHFAELAKLDKPVYLLYPDKKPFEGIKKRVQFPVREIIDYFPLKYYTSSPSWMIAFALYEALTECKGDMKNFKWRSIQLWGIDMMTGWSMRNNISGAGDMINPKTDKIESEYACQRPSVELWLGVIEGLRLAGVDCKMVVPRTSSLLKFHRYYGLGNYLYDNEISERIRVGLETRLKFVDARERELNNQIGIKQNDATNTINSLNQEIAFVRGKMMAIQSVYPGIDNPERLTMAEKGNEKTVAEFQELQKNEQNIVNNINALSQKFQQEIVGMQMNYAACRGNRSEIELQLSNY